MSTKLNPEVIAARFTPPQRAPELSRLAAACHTGACNVFALTIALGEAVKAELQFHEAREHPAVLLILGQLSYLCNESLGPTMETLDNYDAWTAQLKT